MANQIPQPVLIALSRFSKDLNEIEKAFVELQEVTPEQRAALPPLQRAKLDLMTAQIVLKLYGAYAATFGRTAEEDEENAGVYARRIADAMERVRVEEDRPSRPRVQKQVARAFVRNALYDPAGREAEEFEEGEQITSTAHLDEMDENAQFEVEGDDPMDEDADDNSVELDDSIEDNF